MQLKRRFLDRELAWAEVEKRETVVKGFVVNQNKHQDTLNKIENEKQKLEEQLGSHQKQTVSLQDESKAVFMERLNLEAQAAGNQSTLKLVEQFLEEAKLLKQKIWATYRLNFLNPKNSKKSSKPPTIRLTK